MNTTEILGLAAAALTTIANIPQAVKVIKAKATKSISAVTYAMLFAGMALWVVYGIMRKDIPIMIANSIAALLCGIILTIKLYMMYKGEKEE